MTVCLQGGGEFSVGCRAMDADLVARAGGAITIGTASAGEDVAVRSNTGGITISGATTAGDDVQRCDGGRETHAHRIAGRDGGEALERQREVHSALAAGHRMDFVDDHPAD